MSTTNLPIEVSNSTLPTTAASAFRYLLTMAGTYAIAKGWVKAENLDGIVTAVITLGTVAYGLWKTHQNRQKLITTAEAAPNSVARVTS